MSPSDIIFYFGEYRGAKWSYLCEAEYERLVRLVALGIFSFGVSKEHFFKLLEKDITATIDYLNSSSPDGIDIQAGLVKEPEFVQGDLPL